MYVHRPALQSYLAAENAAMSHEIMELDRPVFGFRKPAWHGLGLVLDESCGTASDVVQRYINWQVGTEPVFTKAGLEVENCNAITRLDLADTDDRRILGYGSDRYEPIQHDEIASLVDELCGEAGADIETAGTLRNGKTVWFLARNKLGIRIAGSDLIQDYLLVRSSHDRSSALEGFGTRVRVVCANTLAAATSGNKSRFSVRHTACSHDRIADIKAASRMMAEDREQFAQICGTMAETPIDSKFVANYLTALYPDPKDGANKSRAQNVRQSIVRNFCGGQPMAQELKGTAWALYNAVTQYLSHDSTVRTTEKNGSERSARMESVLWGSSANKAEEAQELLVESLGLTGSAGMVAAPILRTIDKPKPSSRPEVEELLAGLAL